MMLLYTPGEVLWLLSLTRAEAIDLDASPPSQLSGMTVDQTSGSCSEEDRPLPVIARWHDVHDARVQVVVEHARTQILNARAAGMTETDAAAETGMPRSTVRRRFDQVMASLVDTLNLGDMVNPDADQVTKASERCMSCGGGPRVKVRTTDNKPVHGGWRHRQTNLCARCVRPDQRARIVHP